MFFEWLCVVPPWFCHAWLESCAPTEAEAPWPSALLWPNPSGRADEVAPEAALRRPLGFTAENATAKVEGC